MFIACSSGQEEFGKLKPTLPNGQLPALQIDGQYFQQSKAIELYIARKAGLYPTDSEHALLVDQTREVCVARLPTACHGYLLLQPHAHPAACVMSQNLADASAPLSAIVYGPEDKRDEEKAKYLSTTLPQWLGCVHYPWAHFVTNLYRRLPVLRWLCCAVLQPLGAQLDGGWRRVHHRHS